MRMSAKTSSFNKTKVMSYQYIVLVPYNKLYVRDNASLNFSNILSQDFIKVHELYASPTLYLPLR